MTVNRRQYEGTCARCDTAFVAAKPSARYCSDNCRKRAHEHTDKGRARCIDCGELRGASTAYEAEGRCSSCKAKYVEWCRKQIATGYRAGLAAWEIAERTGIPHNTVKAEAYRLRQRGIAVPLGSTGATAHRKRVARMTRPLLEAPDLTTLPKGDPK